MGIFEEIRGMQSQGLPENQIRDNLKSSGFSGKEIENAMSQMRIKAAVEEKDAPFPVSKEDQEYSPEYNPGMQKSLLPPEAEEAQVAEEQYVPQVPPQAPQQYAKEYSPEQGYENYQPYQSYASPSSDLITEISEQILSEKLAPIRKSLEKTIDLKNSLGTKIDYLDERLKRMEKIIDILQSSVLRKVGDYVSDVQDIKAELIETQKSLGKMLPKSSGHKDHAKHHKHKK